MVMKRFGSFDMELLAVIPNIIKLLPGSFTLLMGLSREALIDQFTDRTTELMVGMIFADERAG